MTSLTLLVVVDMESSHCRGPVSTLSLAAEARSMNWHHPRNRYHPDLSTDGSYLIDCRLAALRGSAAATASWCRRHNNLNQCLGGNLRLALFVWYSMLRDLVSPT